MKGRRAIRHDESTLASAGTVFGCAPRAAAVIASIWSHGGSAEWIQVGLSNTVLVASGEMKARRDFELVYIRPAA